MKKTIAMTLGILLACQPMVSWAELSASAVYDPKVESVVLTGEDSGKDSAGITITILPEGRTPDSITDAAPPADVRLIFPESDGGYESVIKLSNTLASGKYDCYVTSKNGNAVISFYHICQTEAAPLLPLINKAASTSALAALLLDNSTTLGIAAEEFSAHAETITGLMLAHKGSGYHKTADFYSAYNTALACVYINSGAVDATLKRFAYSLGIDYHAYSTLAPSVISKLDTLLIQYDYTKQSFAAAYPQEEILAKILTADRWSKLKEIVLAHTTDIGISVSALSSYDKVDNKDEVFTLMYAKDFRRFPDIQKNFNSSVEQVLAKQSGNNNLSGGENSGGSGGGGRNSIGNFQVDDPSDIPQSTDRPGISLPDITGHWAEQQIRFLEERRIVAGFEDGNFRPEVPVTRAEFIKLLMADTAPDTKSLVCPLTDIEPGAWYAPFVAAAYQDGITIGSDNNFYPEENISRQDAATMLYRYLETKGMTPAGDYIFADQERIADYALPGVTALAAAGILNGWDGNFSPLTTTTRAQAATMIYNILNFLDNQL